MTQTPDKVNHAEALRTVRNVIAATLLAVDSKVHEQLDEMSHFLSWKNEEQVGLVIACRSDHRINICESEIVYKIIVATLEQLTLPGVAIKPYVLSPTHFFIFNVSCEIFLKDLSPELCERLCGLKKRERKLNYDLGNLRNQLRRSLDREMLITKGGYEKAPSKFNEISQLLSDINAHDLKKDRFQLYKDFGDYFDLPAALSNIIF